MISWPDMLIPNQISFLYWKYIRGSLHMIFVVERGSCNQFKLKILNLEILITFKRLPMHGLCCVLRPHTWHVRIRDIFHGLRTYVFTPKYALIPKKHIKFFKLWNHHNIKLGGQRLCIMGMWESLCYKTWHVSYIKIYVMAYYLALYPYTMAWA